jgi:hypothetical protein
MPYREPTTVTEITKRLEGLQDQLSIMIESLGPNHIEEEGNLKDVRIATLKNCKADISTNIVLLNIFVAKENKGITMEQWFRLTGIQPKDTGLDKIEDKIRHYLQLSLIIMFQFRIENMVTNILEIFNKKQARRGYYEKTEALLDILSLKDKERKLKILNILAFTRNSLHSGGINNKFSLDVTIDGFRFNFPKGQPVRYAGWGHIDLAMEHILIIINEILHSEKVKAIPEPISLSYIEPELEKMLHK